MQQHPDQLKMEEEPFLKGTVNTVIYHNDANLYTVLKVKVRETSEAIEDKVVSVTGYFPALQEEETYTFYGKTVTHPKFGLQFQAEHFKKEIPTTKEGVIQYLSSDLFEGIGKKTAEEIVKKLGDSAINKILADSSVLYDVPRLSKKKADTLAGALQRHQGLEQIMISLNQFGFGPQLSMKIYQAYESETLEKIQENPYQLVRDVEGIGFGKADELGGRMGLSGNHPERIKAAILYTLETTCLSEGHTYIETKQLIIETQTLLNQSAADGQRITEMDAANAMIALGENKDIVIEDERCYFPSLFFAEQNVAKRVKQIASQTEYDDQFPESEFLLALGELEERMNVQYAPSQKEAIQKALSSPMLLLTGGPGTGKTTVIRGIVELYGELHGASLDPSDYKKDEAFPIVLAAPTGRAAKRMSESTGLPAVTIHRLLGWNGAEGFTHTEDQPIEGKLLIIDEASMLDIWLANHLFKAIPDHIQIIIVGDEDQLPSVGPGQVLRDLLASQVIPTVRLTDIYRQAEGSSIVELAHEMKNGLLPNNLTAPTKDRSFIRCGGSQIKEVVEKVVANALKKGYTAKDIQVLAPMYRGKAGINELNVMLQDILNPPKEKRREIKFGDVVYRTGDKILQLVNQPENNVFNGDIGEITSIFYAKENTEKEDMAVVSFDGNEMTFTKKDFSQFTHAYCCSIHKSQGSEFPIVVLPVVKGYYRMLRRNLLYTAITRAKKFLILCGEEEALEWGVKNNDATVRQTSLKNRLSAQAAEMDAELAALQKELPFSVHDANIGMEGITPFDFMKEEQL
ncbi:MULTISPECIES: SF1B family DNA helicase RecD2 [Bacillus]|uniref:SF1B family DNA helicase RecD2 n=1 Tax=Bacillus TaxID=1386 RepID=UPI000FDC37FE|nr:MULTISPECIES: ATP-dependent RecD-like DNA helicase [Bacillus]MBV7318300.1 ATP-dependent RecD-like DNA helicase [Halalkalibacterium halodurans]AZV50733.1 ATP-dependent RecD-like DNA helicase [Bacillus halotolerans]MCV0022812.1 ATP-dependent RecD-like DNA helicase [Bacillus sp. XT-2]QNS18994.1 ATP-dependent RecD-like DNA helicase [Bacillus halotolerans]WHY23224.1 ATP-dependent RecD-like DNA helicase [Bacillus halotolerans]